MARSQRLVPRELVEKKPKHGEACNHCGLCCFSEKCDIGQALFGGTDGPCPALRFIDKQSRCNVIDNPHLYSSANPDDARAAAMLILYAGHGCTMRINGERNETFIKALDAYDLQHKREFSKAMQLWGIPEPSQLP